ncbi:hypothetical protein E3N88_00787 [Mikania micrantha]|uniref:Uncharacterized protein n=1 Tax=Mikania micrantha TaxID=192012 RepID=A0A5N6Q110_9ASTR|nr:hypothetical protein E3N88_00787 [Mikania micrantha]
MDNMYPFEHGRSDVLTGGGGEAADGVSSSGTYGNNGRTSRVPSSLLLFDHFYLATFLTLLLEFEFLHNALSFHVIY